MYLTAFLLIILRLVLCPRKSWAVFRGNTKHRKGSQRTTKDRKGAPKHRKGPQKHRKRTAKDRKGAPKHRRTQETL